MGLIKLNEEQKDRLVDEAIERIKKDIEVGDVTAIDELLRFVPDDNLVGFLAEGDEKKYHESLD